jgi:hypothetical protein
VGREVCRAGWLAAFELIPLDRRAADITKATVVSTVIARERPDQGAEDEVRACPQARTLSIAVAVLWTRMSRRKTGPSRGCGPGWSIGSPSSSGSSGFAKARCRELTENRHLRIWALANLYMGRWHLLRCQAVKCARTQAGKPCGNLNRDQKRPKYRGVASWGIPAHHPLDKPTMRSFTTAPYDNEVTTAASATHARRAGTRCRGNTAVDPRASLQRGASHEGDSTRVSNLVPDPRSALDGCCRTL